MSGRVRIAVAGAGFMARRRSLAFLHSGRAEICAVAARRRSTAAALSAEIGCPAWFDDVRDCLSERPDALLVEVPNAAQDEIVLWALGARLPVLIGGPLSTSVAGGERICRAAQRAELAVEAGYEARYKPAWEAAKQLVAKAQIGRVVAVRTVALWPCEPGSWYALQSRTGGMPLAHMSYAFINPLRWIFGEPTHVSAFANQVVNRRPGAVSEETCVANLRFPGAVICSATAGFVRPFERETWSVWIVGETGAIELLPTEMDAGSLRLHRGAHVETVAFDATRDAFVAQAEAFLDSLTGSDRRRNPPEAVLNDLRVAEAIARSARSLQTVALARVPDVTQAPGRCVRSGAPS